MATLFLIISICLLIMYLRKSAELRDFKNIHLQLHETSGLESIVNVIASELKRKGIDKFKFFKINRGTYQLESNDINAPLFTHNSLAKAFLTMTPQRLDMSIDIDRQIDEKTFPKAVAIPIYMNFDGSCWENDNCNRSNTCRHYGHKNKKCWLTDTKFCKDKIFKNYKEKLAECVMCKSFLPLGVFVMETKNPTKITHFLNSTFGGFLRNSLSFDKAVFSATRDPLTNLLNKRSLLHNLELSLKLSKRHENFPVSVCIFDIDHFKRFNDTYGHAEGDRLLKELAALLMSQSRETDTVARYGGEEFLVIYPNTDKKGAAVSAEKLRAAVENNIFCDDKRITISLGVAGSPEDGIDPIDPVSDIIKKADAALYQSKTTRNRVTVYTAGMTMKGEDKSAANVTAEKKKVKGKGGNIKKDKIITHNNGGGEADGGLSQASETEPPEQGTGKDNFVEW